MGYGSYRSSDWAKLKSSAKITDAASASQIFTSRSMEERFNPAFINMRESMDSEDHPNSTPIIIGLDTTGSMGYLSEEIAKNGLNETMLKLYSTGLVEDPQIMFAAVGDILDEAPLQVTQFESDIRIAEQLLALWLEGKGFDAPEDFELLWYFADKHTRTDSFNKHGKKGFLFTIGDADVHEKLEGKHINRIFSDKADDSTSEELAKKAMEKYEVYHIHLTNGKYIPPVFANVLPGRVATLGKDEVSRIPELIISIMLLSLGESPDKVYANWDPMAAKVVKKAVDGMVFKTKKSGFFF